MERRYACRVDEMNKGASMTVDGSPPIALYRNDDGEFYATADTCTHEHWSLGTDSELQGNEVTCPLHLAQFDITTGAPLCVPATIALQTYRVEIEDGSVYVLV
jgi:nitrite reductase/ring-hydroxylating ferredoxin subunit